jgi:predicted enzyme related to lactoylglutathione lyase
MTSGLQTVLYPTKDLASAKALYRTILGVEPMMDEPYYVGFQVNGLDVGLDPNGHEKGMAGSVAYWRVDDIEKSLEAVLAAGAQPVQPVTNVGGGRRIATVKDADGNVVGLLQDAG